MPYHLYRVARRGTDIQRVGMHVRFDEDRWVCTCHEVDDTGNEKQDSDFAAPKCFGVTAHQACCRMEQALAEKFDEVEPIAHEAAHR